MERCKKGGKSKKTRGRDLNEDRISELPEALIQKILCLLPTNVAITTSVLSKQWQYHWKMLPELKFGTLGQVIELEHVCKALLSHKAPVLESFHLKVRIDNVLHAVDTGILIGIAITRNVRNLLLGVYCENQLFTFPRSLYSSCGTLETLKLVMNVTLDVPSSVCLKSLRTLHLESVCFEDEESVFNFLSACPNLQCLVLLLRTNTHKSVKTFTIALPSLQRLTINSTRWPTILSGYVINTPCLKYLDIEVCKPLHCCLIEKVPEELVEARIYLSNKRIVNENVMVSLISVKRLSLGLSPLNCFEFPRGIIFHQLVYLKLLYTNRQAHWHLLTLMLDSSPNLQVLKIIDDCRMENPSKFKEPNNVPECLLFHLETFMWENYKWEREEHKKVAKYILKNTNGLKRATFSATGICSKDMCVVIKDLKSLVKSKDSCQFQFTSKT